jgi:hypothetical protein
MGTDVLAQLGELTTLQQLRLRVVSSSLGIVAPLANLKQLEELLVSCKLVLDAPNANVQGLQAVLLACPRLRHLQLACRSVQEPAPLQLAALQELCLSDTSGSACLHPSMLPCGLDLGAGWPPSVRVRMCVPGLHLVGATPMQVSTLTQTVAGWPVEPLHSHGSLNLVFQEYLSETQGLALAEALVPLRQAAWAAGVARVRVHGGYKLGAEAVRVLQSVFPAAQVLVCYV